MNTYYFPVTWGGEDTNETLSDSLAKIRSLFPGVKLTKTDWTSGGWPVYQAVIIGGQESEMASYLEGEG